MKHGVNKSLLKSRSLFALTGPDVEGFLQGLVTQDMKKLTVGGAVHTGLLTPQGKLVAEFFICREAERFILDCASFIADNLVKKLTLYKLRAKVAITNISEQICVTALWPRDDEPMPNEAVPDPRLEALGWRIYGSPPKGNFNEASEDDYWHFLIRQGVPSLGMSFGPEQFFPLDVNMDVLNGISYTKGCFVGQEVASRMKRKGDIRKRTLIARGDGLYADLTLGEALTAGDVYGEDEKAKRVIVGKVYACTDKNGLCLVRLDRLQKIGEVPLFCNGQKVVLIWPDYLKGS